MALLDKRTAIIVGASTAIGFLGDAVIYSLGESKGGKFKLVIPKGTAALQLLALGVITGLAVDFSIKQIESALLTKQEASLQKLVEIELAKIRLGERQGLMPEGVIWNKATTLAGTDHVPEIVYAHNVY